MRPCWPISALWRLLVKLKIPWSILVFDHGAAARGEHEQSLCFSGIVSSLFICLAENNKVRSTEAAERGSFHNSQSSLCFCPCCQGWLAVPLHLEQKNCAEPLNGENTLTGSRSAEPELAVVLPSGRSSGWWEWRAHAPADHQADNQYFRHCRVLHS